MRPNSQAPNWTGYIFTDWKPINAMGLLVTLFWSIPSPCNHPSRDIYIRTKEIQHQQRWNMMKQHPTNLVIFPISRCISIGSISLKAWDCRWGERWWHSKVVAPELGMADELMKIHNYRLFECEQQGTVAFPYVSIPINRVGWIAGCSKVELAMWYFLCDRFYARLLQRALVVVLCLFELVLSRIPARYGQQCADFPRHRKTKLISVNFKPSRTGSSSQIEVASETQAWSCRRGSQGNWAEGIFVEASPGADVEKNTSFPPPKKEPQPQLHPFMCLIVVNFNSWSISCYILSFSGRHPSKVSVATLSCSHSSCWKVCYASRQTSFEEEVCFQRFTGGLSWIRRAALSW